MQRLPFSLELHLPHTSQLSLIREKDREYDSLAPNKKGCLCGQPFFVFNLAGRLTLAVLW